MAAEPRIVPVEAVDEAEVLALLAASLGSGSVPRDARFWRWKHRASPFGPSPGLAALDAAGKVVAVRLFLRWRWRSGDGEVAAVRAVDTATHPDWRRRGLFRRLTLELAERVAAEGAAFVFNTPNPRSRAGYLAMGWHDTGGAPLLVRPRRPGRLLRSLLAGRRAAARDDRAPPQRPAVLAPVEELLADPALPAFLARWAAGETRLHTPRTPEYLRWRYAEAPAPPEGGLVYGAAWDLTGPGRGEAAAAGAGEAGGGAVVVARLRRRRGLLEATLPEILASNDDAGRRAAAELIDRIARHGGAEYLAAVAAPRTPERRALAAAGFLPIPSTLPGLGPRLTVRALRPDGRGPVPDPRERRSWRLAAGDLELF